MVQVSTTDFAYALPARPDSYRIALAGSPLTVSTLDTTSVRGGGLTGWLVLAALAMLACAGFGWWRLRARRPAAAGAGAGRRAGGGE